VEQASTLLTDYNARLQEELKERKKVGIMIAEFLSAQKELLAQVKTTFESVAIQERKMLGIIFVEFLSAQKLLGQKTTTSESLLSWNKRWWVS
jgi:hypothetical protein